MKARESINPLLLVSAEIITFIAPLFILQGTFFTEPLHLKAFIASLTAIIGWSTFKVLTPQLHQMLLNKNSINNTRYWLLIALCASSAILIITSVQSIQAVIGKEIILFLFIGFALEGAGSQWLRNKSVILGIPAYTFGKVALTMMLASVISIRSITMNSPFVIVALAPAALLSLLIASSYLPETRPSIKMERFLHFVFILPPALTSMLVYAGLLPPFFLFTLASLIPLKRFSQALEHRVVPARTGAVVRSLFLYTIVFVAASAASFSTVTSL